MSSIKHAIGIDISTQTITAMLIGVVEENGLPAELIISSAWTESRPCGDEISRKDPSVWVKLIAECIADLKRKSRETALARSIGISTTFPGIFAVLRDGSIDPRYVSLYDNTDDTGICSEAFEDILGGAEAQTMNRMQPGNMAIGLAHLVKTQGLDLNDAAAVVPPNTAFASELLRCAGCPADPGRLFSDFTQTTISGLYDFRTAEPVPSGVNDLIKAAMPGIEPGRVRELLPATAPAWRNAVPEPALTDLRDLLGLPDLVSISIGAGDSSLGALALLGDRDTVINVRGSSDSPMLVIDSPRPRSSPRETVFHYPLATAASLADSPWCVVAPMLRSGKVWDWVRGLRFLAGGENADSELEALALDALKSKLRSPANTPLRFNTALGGERAPTWDPRAAGSITGLIESHSIGDIALAALEGMSATLRSCIEMMEDRYKVRPAKMLVVGGPAKNMLWNWITQVYTGKRVYATTSSNASLLGAALLGYGASYDGTEPDNSIARRLFALSRLASGHPLIAPVAVAPPDEELADMKAEF